MFYDTMQLNFRNTGHLYMELLVGLLCAHVVPKHPKSMVAMYENLYYARCDFKWSCTTPSVGCAGTQRTSAHGSWHLG